MKKDFMIQHINNGYYPNATYKENGCEPSIKGRRIYIPLELGLIEIQDLLYH